jgi:hypothetical protein
VDDEYLRAAHWRTIIEFLNRNKMRVPRAQPNETVEPERHHVRLQAGLGNSYVEIAGQFFLQYYLQQLYCF